MRAESGMSRRHLLRLALAGGGIATSGGIHTLFAQAPFMPRPIAPPPGYMEAAEKALIEPFTGITTDGTVVPGLFDTAATTSYRARSRPYCSRSSRPMSATSGLAMPRSAWRR